MHSSKMTLGLKLIFFSLVLCTGSSLIVSVSCFQGDSMRVLMKKSRCSYASSLHGTLQVVRKIGYLSDSQNDKKTMILTSSYKKKKSFGLLPLQAEKTGRESTSTSSSSNSSQSLNIRIEPLYFAAWVALLVFAFVFAPGEVGSQADNGLIMKLVNDPVGGGDVNRLWFAVWNFFAVVPATLACLLIPSVKKDQWLPAGPFVLSSAFLGYFTLGPYMYLRRSTKGSGNQDLATKKGFVTAILENRFFGIFLAALACSIPFVSGLVDAVATNGAASVLSDYVDLFSSSRFVAVATTDLFILTVIASALIPEDLKLRRGGKEGKYDIAIAVSTLLLPAIGSALYIALRPPTIEE